MKSPWLGQTVHLDFTTTNPGTGAAATASATTVRVFEEATDTAISTPTATERSGHTGNYRVPVVCTTANGFEAGKTYNVVVEATVAGVTAKAVISSFVVGPPVTLGTVLTDGANTSSTFKTDLTEAATDYWKDCFLTFLTGSLAGQTKPVSAFNFTTDFITTSAFTAAPSNGDRFLLVNV